MRSIRLALAIGLLVASGALFTSCSSSGTMQSMPSGSQGQASRPQSTNALVNVDWPSYNNDLRSQRFSPLTTIDALNASKLHKVCSFPVAQVSSPTGFNFETGPIVVSNVMYFSTINDTYAINASNCNLIWDTTRPAHGGGLADRGVVYDKGQIFRGTIDGSVVAMNAQSGKIIWDHHIANAPETITAAPIAYNGVIYIGTSGAESGAQCHVFAVDERSGTVLWSYQTVPSDSSSTIPDWVDSTGSTPTHPAGGSTWSSYTLDPARNILYVSTGNPGPDFDDRDRGGADAFTNSVIALNASNGKLLAGYSLVPHDVHDYDMAAAPVVAGYDGNAPIVAAGKDGYAYSINRGDGTLRWKTPVTTVDAAPAPPVPGVPVNFCPGTTGGVEWNGPAYSPLLNAVFTNGVDHCATQLTEEATFTPFSQAAQCGGIWVGATPCYSFGVPSTVSFGWINAIDASTGNVRWKYQSPTPMIAGVTVTASGLLMTGDLNGNVLVFDASTGNVLNTISTGEPIGGGVITYAVNAKQYVAAAAGIASSLIWSPTQPNGPSSIVILGL